MKTYKVIFGIFEGTVFKGEIIKDRVHNINSVGQSFPIQNCIEL